MNSLFQFIDTLSPAALLISGILIAVVMTLIPFLNSIRKALLTLLRNERPEIKDFSWRIAPETKLTEDGEREMYLTSTSKPFVYEGMVLQLNWNVSGAFRVDLNPVKKRIRGNSARVIIHAGQNQYQLVAYTWRGRLRAHLELSAAEVQSLNSLNLGQDTFFGQGEKHALTTGQLSACDSLNATFSRAPLKKLTPLATTTLRPRKTSEHFGFMRTMPEVSTQSLEPRESTSIEKAELQYRFNNSPLMRGARFNPAPYNEILRYSSKSNHQHNNPQ